MRRDNAFPQSYPREGSVTRGFLDPPRNSEKLWEILNNSHMRAARYKEFSMRNQKIEKCEKS